ncbi:TetR/AcrR family transcriptional regulator [Corynebacterium sp. CCM 8863]|uniref:TetR/AcrR family transcriptional regulator n=1 Tax=Corynebacterium meridianum TaxID=2765363 RepID=A0A934M806_9CORY|nr:TetR/AcrR family transcriptional regulator [Corynebacterium meridianum]
MAAATTKPDKPTGRSTSRGRTGRRRNRPSPRERLLASATNLFTTEGIRVIGIDRILREADVAKASLYSLFGSKDALVIAYLQDLDEKSRADWARRTAEMTDPVDKILAFFDQAIDEEPGQDFRGSHFQNAANEYPRPETESERGIVSAVQEHRRWTLQTMVDLLTQLNGYPGTTQANQLLIFLDGGLAGARLNRSVEPLQTARELAKQLLMVPPADYSI